MWSRSSKGIFVYLKSSLFPTYTQPSASYSWYLSVGIVWNISSLSSAFQPLQQLAAMVTATGESIWLQNCQHTILPPSQLAKGFRCNRNRAYRFHLKSTSHICLNCCKIRAMLKLLSSNYYINLALYSNCSDIFGREDETNLPNRFLRCRCTLFQFLLIWKCIEVVL